MSVAKWSEAERRRASERSERCEQTNVASDCLYEKHAQKPQPTTNDQHRDDDDELTILTTLTLTMTLTLNLIITFISVTLKMTICW